MPSPFPGMNPYLEGPVFWPSFHDDFILTLKRRLANALKSQYHVASQQNVYIHELPDEPGIRIGVPDAYIRGPRPAKAGSIAAFAAPKRAKIPRTIEEIAVPYLTITDRTLEHVITVIEVLSPSNKSGSDRPQYLGKREDYLKSEANFIEIDLLRQGPRLPLLELSPCDYVVMISRPSLRPEVEVWPVQLRERLPEIPIPLREGDQEPIVDLQSVLNEVYDNSTYELSIYRHTPAPPLAASDMAWANEIINV